MRPNGVKLKNQYIRKDYSNTQKDGHIDQDPRSILNKLGSLMQEHAIRLNCIPKQICSHAYHK